MFRNERSILVGLLVCSLGLQCLCKPSGPTDTDSDSSPMDSLAKGFASIPTTLAQGQLFEAQAQVVSAIAKPFNLSQAEQMVPLTKEITRLGEKTTKVFSKVSGLTFEAPPEPEVAYHDFGPNEEWHGYRRPKYFSRECNFRAACELGRLMRPMFSPLTEQFKTNKIMQDLQSRYSRAWTYGSLNDNCNKYYCVFLQLLSGPQNFVAGSAELVRMIASTDED